MRLRVIGGLCLRLRRFGLRRSTEHAQNPCLAPSKEMRTLRTLKSGAKRREEEGRPAAVSAPGLWRAELSWCQARLWPLRTFSAEGALRGAKVPPPHGTRLS